MLLLLLLLPSTAWALRSLSPTSIRCRTLLLAATQEQDEARALCEQALMEEQLMHMAPMLPLISPKEVSSKRIAGDVHRLGVCRVDNALASESVDAMQSFVQAELARALAAIASDASQAKELLSVSLAKGNRWDLRLSCQGPVRDALVAALAEGTMLGDSLFRLVGADAELFELATFVTVQGADRQVMHSDTLWSALPCLYTCTIALQDVDQLMGPTTFIPGSNCKATHRIMDSEAKGKRYLQSAPHVLSTLSKGDAAIYDSRTYHCGGANRSPRSRSLFYFTFTNPAGMAQDDDSWNVASIRADSRGRFRLGDFR